MSESSGQQPGNFRVLIADDDTLGSRRFGEFLKERGFAVEHAATGKNIKEIIRSTKPHFVVCDLMLSDMNAPQLLSYIKDPSFEGHKPKILVTSSHNVVKNIKECIQLGASD